MNTIIIARYTECLNWILDIPDYFNIFIYNKGPKIDNEDIIGKASLILPLENIGRESETYLCHMISHHDAGGGFTVFTQGDPLTHSPDLIEILKGWRQWQALQPLSWQWRADRNIPPALLLQDYARYLGDAARIRPERYSLTTWNPLDFFDAGAYQAGINYRTAHHLSDGVNVAAHFLHMCGFEELALKAVAHRVGVFSYGGIFAVRNDLVRTLRKDRALKLYEASVGHPVYGYILERLWLHLFGAEFELPVSTAQRLASTNQLADYCFDRSMPVSLMAIADSSGEAAAA